MVQKAKEMKENTFHFRAGAFGGKYLTVAGHGGAKIGRVYRFKRKGRRG